MFTGKFNAPACAAALSTQSLWEQALDQVIVGARGSLGSPPDLVVIFFSSHHAQAAEQIAAEASQRLAPATVIGCTGESIAGTGQEVEDGPALSLWMARWPNVRITPMHLRLNRTPEGSVIEGWADSLPAEWSPDDFLIALGEPFSFPADFLLERLNEDQPNVPVLGGMASGGMSPGENRLILAAQSWMKGPSWCMSAARFVCGRSSRRAAAPSAGRWW